MPAYNHTREDSPRTPCPICAAQLATGTNEPKFNLAAARAMLENILADNEWDADRCRDLHVELTMAVDRVVQLEAALRAACDFGQALALDSYDPEHVRIADQLTELEKLAGPAPWLPRST